ncbi:MAG: hypothetical protein RLZZ536_3325, partial [Planctomycetota bacterium]
MKLICRRCQSELEINAADLKKIGKRCLQCGFPTLETPADNCELQLSAQSSGAPQPSQNSLRQSTMQNHPAVASKATDDSRSHRTCARLIT